MILAQSMYALQSVSLSLSQPLEPFWSKLLLVLGGGIGAFVLAYFLTFAVSAVCWKMAWLDMPSARRIHKKPFPRLGGVAMYLAFVIVSLVLYATYHETKQGELGQYWLVLVGATLITAVHVYDDIKGLKPLPKLIAQTISVLIILGPFLDGSFHGVILFGFNNPFGVHGVHPELPWYRQQVIDIFIQKAEVSLLALPAVLITWFWMVGMMNTINWMDGMDGLATGIVGIAAFFIAVISWRMGQTSIALLSAIFTGAVLGFLPHNWNPAKIIMGDSGSQFLGLLLAVLAIMGGAKVALALMVLGIPILDVAIVIINRVRRGQSPAHYDKTHLHHRLLATGLSVRQICYILYGLMISFGLLAYVWDRPLYKLGGIGLVVVVMVGLIIWLDYRQRQRGMAVELGGPGSDPQPSGDPETSNDQKPAQEQHPAQSRRLEGKREDTVEVSEASSSS